MSASRNFQVACDHCDAALASIFCHSDGAFLCDSCDTKVHSVNKIAQRHVRVPHTSCPVWAYREAKSKGRTNQVPSGLPPPAKRTSPVNIFDPSGAGAFHTSNPAAMAIDSSSAPSALNTHNNNAAADGSATPQLFCCMGTLHADLQRDLGDDPMGRYLLVSSDPDDSAYRRAAGSFSSPSQQQQQQLQLDGRTLIGLANPHGSVESMLDTTNSQGSGAPAFIHQQQQHQHLQQHQHQHPQMEASRHQLPRQDSTAATSGALRRDSPAFGGHPGSVGQQQANNSPPEHRRSLSGSQVHFSAESSLVSSAVELYPPPPPHNNGSFGGANHHNSGHIGGGGGSGSWSWQPTGAHPDIRQPQPQQQQRGASAGQHQISGPGSTDHSRLATMLEMFSLPPESPHSNSGHVRQETGPSSGAAAESHVDPSSVWYHQLASQQQQQQQQQHSLALAASAPPELDLASYHHQDAASQRGGTHFLPAQSNGGGDDGARVSAQEAGGVADAQPLRSPPAAGLALRLSPDSDNQQAAGSAGGGNGGFNASSLFDVLARHQQAQAQAAMAAAPGSGSGVNRLVSHLVSQPPPQQQQPQQSTLTRMTTLDPNASSGGGGAGAAGVPSFLDLSRHAEPIAIGAAHRSSRPRYESVVMSEPGPLSLLSGSIDSSVSDAWGIQSHQLSSHQLSSHQLSVPQDVVLATTTGGGGHQGDAAGGGTLPAQNRSLGNAGGSSSSFMLLQDALLAAVQQQQSQHQQQQQQNNGSGHAQQQQQQQQFGTASLQQWPVQLVQLLGNGGTQNITAQLVQAGPHGSVQLSHQQPQLQFIQPGSGGGIAHLKLNDGSGSGNGQIFQITSQQLLQLGQQSFQQQQRPSSWQGVPILLAGQSAGPSAQQPPSGGSSTHGSSAALAMLQSLSENGPSSAQPQQMRTAAAPSTPPPAGSRRSHFTDPFQMVTRIERPDGTYKEVDPQRAAQLYRYRVKRNLRLKAIAEGQKKIRYECRRTLAETRVRVKGRFAKGESSGQLAEQEGSGLLQQQPAPPAQQQGQQPQQQDKAAGSPDTGGGGATQMDDDTDGGRVAEGSGTAASPVNLA